MDAAGNHFCSSEVVGSYELVGTSNWIEVLRSVGREGGRIGELAS